MKTLSIIIAILSILLMDSCKKNTENTTNSNSYNNPFLVHSANDSYFFIYDDNKRIIEMHCHYGTSYDLWSTYSYDKNLLHQRQYNGYYWYELDDILNSEGRIITEIDGNGDTIHFEYQNGYLIRQVRGYPLSPDSLHSATITQYFYENGNNTKTVITTWDSYSHNLTSYITNRTFYEDIKNTLNIGDCLLNSPGNFFFTYSFYGTLNKNAMKTATGVPGIDSAYYRYDLDEQGRIVKCYYLESGYGIPFTYY
jgi:hypothetical protein